MFLDQCVIAVAAIHALWRFEIVRAFKFDSGDALNDVHKAVDGHNLVAAEVKRFNDIAGENRLGSLQAIIDIHEAAGLMPIAPNLDFMLSRELRLNDFATNGCGCLLPAAVVSSERTVNV